MSFLGRRVIMTTLDPMPPRRDFRFAPGLIAMNHREARELAEGDGDTFKALAALVHAEDALESRNIGVRRRWKRPNSKRSPKLNPSSRLSMVNAIYRGKR